MTIETLEQSVDDLMCECYNAALTIAYYPDLTVRHKPENISDSLFDEIWSWVDGLYQKNFFDKMSGHCSLKDFLEFSMEDEERYMRDFLTRLRAINDTI